MTNFDRKWTDRKLRARELERERAEKEEKRMSRKLDRLAYAVVDESGGLACWDYRLPICWLKALAAADCAQYAQYGFNNKVVRVRITIDEPKRSIKRKR